MRYAELTLHPDSEGFHPVDRAAVETDALERIAIRQFNRKDDGTVILLYQLRGDRQIATQVLEADPDVRAYSLSESGRELHLYVHINPNGIVDLLTSLPHRYSLVVDTPIECLADGGLRAVVVGDQDIFADALDSIPDGIRVELESIRAYNPESRRPDAELTERQQEVLVVALEAGYYQVPRQATHEDIAEALDLSPVTVGEHLRKVEASVLTQVASNLG